MASLALVTVSKFNSNDIERQRLISYSHVRGFEGINSNADTLVQYAPSKDIQVDILIADDTYSSFSTGYESKGSSVGVPMYFISVDGLEVNAQRVVDTSSIYWIEARDTTTCTLVYLDRTYNLHSAVVLGTLASIRAAEFIMAFDGYRDGTLTVTGNTTLITFSSRFPDGTVYDIYYTELDPIGIDTAATDATKTEEGFELATPLVTSGSGTYFAVARK